MVQCILAELWYSQDAGSDPGLTQPEPPWPSIHCHTDDGHIHRSRTCTQWEVEDVFSQFYTSLKYFLRLLEANSLIPSIQPFLGCGRTCSAHSLTVVCYNATTKRMIKSLYFTFYCKGWIRQSRGEALPTFPDFPFLLSPNYFTDTHSSCVNILHLKNWWGKTPWEFGEWSAENLFLNALHDKTSMEEIVQYILRPRVILLSWYGSNRCLQKMIYWSQSNEAPE